MTEGYSEYRAEYSAQVLCGVADHNTEKISM